MLTKVRVNDLGPDSKIIDAGIKDTNECRGKVTLSNGFNETVVRETQHVHVKNIDKVTLEGCGCFQLYNKKNQTGKSSLLGSQGEFSSEEIGFSSVRVVVRKADCETNPRTYLNPGGINNQTHKSEPSNSKQNSNTMEAYENKSKNSSSTMNARIPLAIFFMVWLVLFIKM